MSKEHVYAYEAGYRDGSINYELEHCPACNNVANLQDALDENAKLRQELEIRKMSEQEKTIEYLRQENIDWEDKYRALAAENSKLRKCMNEVSGSKQNDLLTEYGTATTAYILMALSIDSLGRRNEQLTAENAKLREFAARAWRLFTEKGAVHPSDLPEVDAVRDGLIKLGVEISK